MGPHGFVAQIAFAKDSLSDSIVLAGGHEQLDTDEVQDPELGGLQFFTQATRIVIDLV